MTRALVTTVAALRFVARFQRTPAVAYLVFPLVIKATVANDR